MSLTISAVLSHFHGGLGKTTWSHGLVRHMQVAEEQECALYWCICITIIHQSLSYNAIIVIIKCALKLSTQKYVRMCSLMDIIIISFK